MKSITFLLILNLIFVIPFSAFSEEDEYKSLLLEFENFRSSFNTGNLEQEMSQNEILTETQKTSSEIEEVQQRWNSLVNRIFEDDAFFSLSSKEKEEIQIFEDNSDLAKSFLKEKQDMASFVRVAYVRNLLLQSAKKELEASLESYSQVVQLEDVLGQFSSFVKDLDTQVGPMLHQKPVQQYYPFPGALTLKASMSEQEVRISKTQYEIVLKNVITKTKVAYLEWAYLNQTIKITQDHLKLLKELETVASVHFRTGKGGFNDVIKAQIKHAKLKDDLVNLKEEKVIREAELAQLVNLSSDYSFTPPETVPLVSIITSVSDLHNLALKNQQELKLLIEELKKSQYAIELAEKNYYPDLSPGFSYFQNRKGNRVGIVKTDQAFNTKPETRPKYWFGKNDAFIREARLHHQALAKKLENHKENMLYQVKAFFFKLDKEERSVNLYQDSLLPLAQKALEVAIAEYKTGKTDFLSLLDAQTTLLNFGIDFQKALRNHGQKKARLEKLIGKELFASEVTNEPSK